MDDYIRTVITLESLDAHDDIEYVVNKLRDILVEVVKELETTDNLLDMHVRE